MNSDGFDPTSFDSLLTPATPRPSKGLSDPIPVPQTQPAVAPETKKPATTPPAATYNNDNHSPAALCDPDDGTETAKPGFGAPINKWPTIGSKEFQQHFDAFAQERRHTIIDNPSVNGAHTSFPGNQSGRPSLSVAIAARQRFFDITFGDTKEFGVGAVVSICEAKRELGDHIKKYSDQKEKTGADQTNSCSSGAFKKASELFSDARNSYTQYAALVDHFLHGFKGKLTSQSTVNIPSLENEFLENRRKNLTNLNGYKPPVTLLHPTKVSEKTWITLKAEYEILWGKGAAERSIDDKQVSPNGLFSSLLLQTRKEKAKAEANADYFKKENDFIEEQTKKCGALTETAAVKPAGTGSEVTATPPANPKAPDVSGASAPNTLDTTQDPNSAPPPPRDQPAAPADTPNPEDKTPPAVVTAPDSSWGAAQPIVAPVLPPTKEPPEKEESGGVGAFLKDNWMWLAGGTVLVGGGVYLYNQHEKSEKKDNYWHNDANFETTTSTISTTTTTDVTTTAAAGSKFIFVTSVPGPGGIGQSMSPLSVAITDSNNVIQNVNGTAILSCAAPSPCSIGGSTTATLTNGQATFTGVTFSNADQNVLLQVSGAGIANTVAPSTFNVSGSTATNPRY